MATLRAQEEKADGTNRVIVSKQDMRITVLCPQETPGEIYGPRFFRLKTPGFTGIGIHGTANPQVIPGRITMGCIRLSNEDLKAFSRLVDVDTRVDILPDKGRERGSLSKLARDDDY